jgi:hypothetical protein
MLLKQFPIFALLAGISLLLVPASDCFNSATLFAQEKGGPKKFINLTSVTPKLDKKTGLWEIKVKGKATSVPANCQIAFGLRYGMNAVDEFIVTLKASKRIDETFTSARLKGFADGMLLSATIKLGSQTEKVQKALLKNTSTFPSSNGRNSWRNIFPQGINLGSAEQISQAAAKSKEYFEKDVKTLIALVGSFKGYEMADEAASKKWLNKNIWADVLKIQNAVKSKGKSLSYIKLSADLQRLEKLAQAVARQIADKIKKACQANKWNLKGFSAPKGVVYKNGKSPTPKSLFKMAKRIASSQGFSL